MLFHRSNMQFSMSWPLRWQPHLTAPRSLRSSRHKSSCRARDFRAYNSMGGAKEAFLGVDFGTSGARCSVIDAAGEALASAKTAYASDTPEQMGEAWASALFSLLQQVPQDVKDSVCSLSIDGTSATTLLLDVASGELLRPPKLYNEAQGAHIVQLAKDMAPPDHTATASTSTLCKVLTWHEEGTWQAAAAAGRRPVILHQADWLASLLHGLRTVTDWNNALKLGFDPGSEQYPTWLTDQPFAELLPASVCPPGGPVAPITAAAAQHTGLPAGCLVCAGTTDSIAAFLAAGVSSPGEAVTSLGSTLAIKLLSEQRADDARYGVYSHRLGDAWLVSWSLLFHACSSSCVIVLQQAIACYLELLSQATLACASS